MKLHGTPFLVTALLVAACSSDEATAPDAPAQQSQPGRVRTPEPAEPEFAELPRAPAPTQQPQPRKAGTEPAAEHRISDKGRDAIPAPTAGSESPEAAFKAFQAAMKALDGKAFVACTTPELHEKSLREMVAGLGVTTDKKKWSQARKLLEKHGLDVSGLPEPKGLPEPGDDANIEQLEAYGADMRVALRRAKTLQQRVVPVKDKGALLVDVMALLDQPDQRKHAGSVTFGSLSELNTATDSATGVMSMTLEAGPNVQTCRGRIEFRKIKGRWFVHEFGPLPEDEKPENEKPENEN